MYRQSLALTFRLYPWVLLLVFGEIILYALMEREILSVGSRAILDSFLYTFVAFYAHLDLLVPEDQSQATATAKLWGFLGRNIALLFSVFLLAGALAFTLYFNLGMDTNVDRDEEVVIVALIILPLSGVFSLLIYGFMGTWLPAYVVNRGRGVRKTLARGKSTFWFVTGRMIIGPGMIIILILLAIEVSSLLVDYPVLYFETDWTPNIITILVYSVCNCFFAWAIVMTAWIFSMAFLKAEDNQGEVAA